MMRFKKEVHERIRIRRTQRFQSWDRLWSHKSDMHDSWSKHTNVFFKHLYCCGICDVTKMENCKQQYRLVHNSYNNAIMPTQGSIPYGATNAYLADFTTNASSDKIIICT